MSKFRAYGRDELPNLMFRDNKDAAILEAKDRLKDEAALAARTQSIIVEEVRDATLSDFFDFQQLLSLMREIMADKIGNDDALSEGEVIVRMENEASADIAKRLDEAADAVGVRIDGFIVVNRWVLQDWWVKRDGTDQ